MSKSNNAAFIAIVATSLFLGGCGLFVEADTDVITDAKQLLEEQKDTNGDPIKVKLPVRLNYSISEKQMIDQNLVIDFELLTEQPIPVLRIDLEVSDGLQLVRHNFRERFVNLGIRQVINRKVVVRPLLENKFYLNVYLITEIGEDKKARLLRIPIGVGDYSLTDNPQARATVRP